jgi:hypothetical protein
MGQERGCWRRPYSAPGRRAFPRPGIPDMCLDRLDQVAGLAAQDVAQRRERGQAQARALDILKDEGLSYAQGRASAYLEP